jgi:hypothetical protein
VHPKTSVIASIPDLHFGITRGLPAENIVGAEDTVAQAGTSITRSVSQPTKLINYRPCLLLVALVGVDRRGVPAPIGKLNH